MSFEFTVKLPIQPYLKKMIAYNREVEPFTLSKGKDIYSEIIYGNLVRHKVVLPKKMKPKYSETLVIKVPDEFLDSKKFCFSKNRINRIDQLLRGLFDDRLYSYLEDHCFGKGDIERHLLLFMEKYKLTEDDILLSTLRVQYLRFRNSLTDKDLPNFRRSYIPSTPPDEVQGRLFH